MARACSFTGHRQIKESHMENIAEMLSWAIESAYGGGCRVFYTGGALGFDTIAAKEVLKYRQTHPDIKLILCLPCQGQDEGWSERQRSIYSYILTSADEVIYAKDYYTDGCMRERNFLLANKCDLLIAYYQRKNSGAYQTVRMAEAMGKDVVNLYDKLDILQK